MVQKAVLTELLFKMHFVKNVLLTTSVSSALIFCYFLNKSFTPEIILRDVTAVRFFQKFLFITICVILLKRMCHCVKKNYF